ncbi:MAG: putative periplasmic or secreted lipoprotein [Alphaproteobacteria bacterium]|nr:putative periplasmic or secreted lipoprotein [Alphaproteobacteria bacterium]
MSRIKYLIPLIAVSALSLQACIAPLVAVGAGAAVGTANSSRQGGVAQVWNDSQISSYIHDAWFKHSTSMFDKLNMTVFEGRVLITGSVQNANDRDTAIRMAWQAPNVRQVINEIRVEPSGGVSGYTKDAWISTQLRTKLLADRDIQSTSIKHEVNGGNIYLIGVARDSDELNRVLSHARNISYVKEVVSYIRLAGSDTLPGGNGNNAR